MPSPSLVLLRTQSDARLVALAREGHERAFEAIVERYRRQLLRACRRVLPEARAEDALQQALMAAWHGIRRGDEVRELRPWLHRIAHNRSLNLLRQSGYDYDELEESLRIADAPGDELERRAVVRQTLQGLASLPPRQRDALLAIAVEGRSQDEVAVELGLSTGAVRQLVHRARCSLRAAATAVAPLPVMTWVAAWGPRGDVAGRVAELSAGAGGTGAAMVLAKAGTVAVIAGGAVAGPALVEKRTHGPQAPAVAIAAPRGDTDARTPVQASRAPRPAVSATGSSRSTAALGGRTTPRRAAATAPERRATERPSDRDDHSGDREGSRSGPSGPDLDERSGHDGDDLEDRSGPSGGDEADRSGPSGGSEDSGEAEPEERSGPSLRTGSSGPGGDDSAEHEPVEPDPEPAGGSGDSSSGPGAGDEPES